MYDDKSFIASFAPVMVVDCTGELYDSRAEYRFAELLDMTRCEYQHNKLAIAIPKQRGGMYKPDFLLERNIQGLNYIDAIDVKGKDLERAPETQKLVRDCLEVFHGKSMKRQYGNTFRSLTLIFPYKILYFDKDTDENGVEAFIYQCPTCGKLEILPKKNHKCSYCGATSKELCDPNWTQWVIDNADKETLPRRTAWEINKINELKSLCEKAGIKLLNKEKTFKVGFPDRIDILWSADAAYENQPTRLKSFGSAKRLQSLITCIESSEDNKNLIRYLARHASDKESIIGQAVFVTPKGIFVAERNSPKLKKGHAYHCSECESGYFSADDDARCPLCGSYRHSIVEGDSDD